MSYEEEETTVIIGNEANVRIVGINISLWDMIKLLVGFTIAIIPAAIIIAVIYTIAIEIMY